MLNQLKREQEVLRARLKIINFSIVDLECIRKSTENDGIIIEDINLDDDTTQGHVNDISNASGGFRLKVTPVENTGCKHNDSDKINLESMGFDSLHQSSYHPIDLNNNRNVNSIRISKFIPESKMGSPKKDKIHLMQVDIKNDQSSVINQNNFRKKDPILTQKHSNLLNPIESVNSNPQTIIIRKPNKNVANKVL